MSPTRKRVDGISGTEPERKLREENRRLRRRLLALERSLERCGGGLQGMLKRRGLRIRRRLPPSRSLVDPEFTQDQRDALYRLLQQYAFRLILRDIIRMRAGFALESLTTYCSRRAAGQYIDRLTELGLVARERNGTLYLARESVTSFGETLEWLVAEIFRREFCAEVVHSVSFRVPPPGGDFDVVASMEGLLVYVEVKSSPPRGIEAEEVEGFLRRGEILAANLSLFFVDTHLRMRDKLVPILEERLGGVARDSRQEPEKVVRLEREIFHAGHRVYLLNASRGIVGNFRCCIMDHLRNITWPQPRP